MAGRRPGPSPAEHRADPPSPPAVFVGAFISVTVLAMALPAPVAYSPRMRLAGAVLIVAGVLLHRTAWRSFSVHGASPATLAVPAVLVEDGPYRHTRNPMYLAGVAILGGWALTAACPAGLGVAAAFALVARVRWIGPEERLLAATLGPAWADYSARVRRWV